MSNYRAFGLFPDICRSTQYIYAIEKFEFKFRIEMIASIRQLDKPYFAVLVSRVNISALMPFQ